VQGENITITAKFQNIVVNQTITNLDYALTFILKCDIFSLTVRTLTLQSKSLPEVYLTLLRDSESMVPYGISTAKTNTTGYYKWTQLAKQSTSYKVITEKEGYIPRALTTILTQDTTLTITLEEMPPPAIALIPPGYLFDLKITAIPISMNYFFFQPIFYSEVSVTNMGRSTDATIHWKVIDEEGNIIHEETFSEYFTSLQTKNYTLSIPIPTQSGTYKLDVEITKPLIIETSKTFTVGYVITFPIFMLIIGVSLFILIIYKRKRR